MSFHFKLLGWIALSLALSGSAAAQQAGGTSGTGATGAPVVQGLEPTSLLPQPSLDSRGQENLTRPDARIDGGTVSSGIPSMGTSLDETPGQVATTPVPMNTPSFGSSIVPSFSGTAVPSLNDAAGSGLLRRQLQTQSPQAGPQILVLSGSVFRGTLDQPNVISARPGLTSTSRPRGISARRLAEGQPVLQGTTSAPRVIALTPAPGTDEVLVFQNDQTAETGVDATGAQVGAQIVEVPSQ